MLHSYKSVNERLFYGFTQAANLDVFSNALEELMTEMSYDTITVSAICDKALVRRATFYRHFSSKDDLLAYIVEKHRSEIEAQFACADAALRLNDYCKFMTHRLIALTVEYADAFNKMAFSPSKRTFISLIANGVAKNFEKSLEARGCLRDLPAQERCAKLHALAVFYAHGLFGAVVDPLDKSATAESMQSALDSVIDLIDFAD